LTTASIGGLSLSLPSFGLFLFQEGSQLPHRSVASLSTSLLQSVPFSKRKLTAALIGSLSLSLPLLWPLHFLKRNLTVASIGGLSLSLSHLACSFFKKEVDHCIDWQPLCFPPPFGLFLFQKARCPQH